MSIRSIIVVDGPRAGILRRKAFPVPRIDKNLRLLISDMIETMKNSSGAGLAAPQVGEPYRVFVAKISEDKVQVFINPQILERSGSQVGYEGCLSIPGYHGKVKRALKVKVRAMGMGGQKFTLELEEFPARVIQHEYDHLEGVLYVDKLVEPIVEIDTQSPESP